MDPEMRVWQAATPGSRSQLCRDLANPDRPTEREIYDVCRGLIDYLRGDVECAIQHAKSSDRPVGDTGDFGGPFPPLRMTYESKDLGNGFFVLYHPIVPYGATVEQLYGPNPDHITWCFYIAVGGTDRRHCIDHTQNGIEVSVFVPFVQTWYPFNQIALVVPSYNLVRIRFPVDRGYVTKELSFPPPN